MKILKDPAEYAKQLADCYLVPSIVRITVDLARLRPELPVEYIEEVAKHLKYDHNAND